MPANQQGLGSVELALIAPILMMFMVLIFQSLKASYVMEQRLIGARNAAWDSALYHGGAGAGADPGQLEGVLSGRDALPDIASLADPANLTSITDPGFLGNLLPEIVNIHDQNVFSFYHADSSQSFTDDYLSLARKDLNEAPLASWTSNLDAAKFTVTRGRAVSRPVPILEAGSAISENDHYVDFAPGWENRSDGMTAGYDPKLEPKLDPVKLYPDAIP